MSVQPHPLAGREAWQCDVCDGIFYPPTAPSECPYCADEDDAESAKGGSVVSVFERETVVSMPDVLDPRVVRGAELLDERMPGWAKKIDLETFLLSSCKRCVLGQLCGDYENGKDRLGIGSGGDHGFDASSGKQFTALEQDWRLAILSRRSA